MTCPFLRGGVCSIAQRLAADAGGSLAPRPHPDACAFCTDRATPPRGVNKVTVSLAAQLRGPPLLRLLAAHGRHLTGWTESQEQLQAVMHGDGVGSQLWRLLESLGIKHTAACKCLELAEQMNAWGPAGCRLARAEIVERMRANAKHYGWGAVATAAARAVTTGLAWRLDLADVYGSLVDEAIRLAELAEIRFEPQPASSTASLNSHALPSLPAS